MGKKVKKKTRNIQHGAIANQLSPLPVTEDGVVEKQNTVVCVHIENAVDLEKVSEKIALRDKERCDDCREGSSDRKGRSKHGKKGGSGSAVVKKKNCVWLCLKCGRVLCGGVGLPTTPQCHAVRHCRQSRHPIVIQLQNPNLCYCFQCNSLIPVVKSEQEDGKEGNNVLLDVAKLIKAGSSKGASIDVEDVWFGSGSVSGPSVYEVTDSFVSDGKDGYVVRGLANLGNTCFFNSVMQNLLAIDQLRSYLMNLDQPSGPLTVALKNFFSETGSKANSRNVVSPKNLFGSICSKAPQFRGYQQQDSQELLTFLLDNLCTEELKMKKSVSSTDSKENEIASSPGSTFVDLIFGGQISSILTCTVCKYSSVKYEPFHDLSIELPKRKSLSRMVTQASRSRKSKLPMKYEAKKGAKVRDKGKTESAPVLVLSAAGPSQTVDSSSLAPSSIPVEEENVDSSLASSSIPLKKEKDDPVDDFTWMDFIESDATSSGLDIVSQNDDDSSIQISESKHTQSDMLQSNPESQNQGFAQSGEQKQNSELDIGSLSENYVTAPQGSEVLLLPYKEESSLTSEMASKDCEVSISGLGNEQEVDFVGLGDLFNEPDIVSVPNSGDKKSSSESDPDEVDDRDTPVSVSSCLSSFLKSELLSGEEGWNCENCAKILWRQQMHLRENHLKTTEDSDFIENGSPVKDYGATVEKDEDLQSTSTQQEDESAAMTECNSTSQESSADQSSGSCSVNNLKCVVSSSKEKTLEPDDGDKVDGKGIKVKRDATKEIRISKAPEILTIHLKRFGQDVRGRFNKLSGHVSFEEKLNLNSYMGHRVDDETKYEYQLIGVVEHSGSIRGGHYIAYVRDKQHTKWFYASDAHVRQVSLDEVFRSEAYLLFYGRV
ncbi:ubiquitinyl hydrolase 1 [Ranunculus cassubicifolius]